MSESTCSLTKQNVKNITLVMENILGQNSNIKTSTAVLWIIYPARIAKSPLSARISLSQDTITSAV